MIGEKDPAEGTRRKVNAVQNLFEPFCSRIRISAALVRQHSIYSIIHFAAPDQRDWPRILGISRKRDILKIRETVVGPEMSPPPPGQREAGPPPPPQQQQQPRQRQEDEM